MLVLVLLETAALGALFVAAVLGGWFGPDVGRGAQFCEHATGELVLQPANTLSNLGFVIAGLAIAWHARRRPGHMPRGLVTAYAMLVVLLGPASAAMHATQSAIGGDLDLTSMFLLSSFALAYAVARLVRRPDRLTFVRVFLAALLAQEVAYFRGGGMPWIEHTGNLAFALAILLVIGIEVALARRAARAGLPGLDSRWLGAAGGALALALGIWSRAKTGGAWCDPDSLLQGHAAWHLLCAFAAYSLYRAYAGPRG